MSRLDELPCVWLDLLSGFGDRFATFGNGHVFITFV